MTHPVGTVLKVARIRLWPPWARLGVAGLVGWVSGGAIAYGSVSSVAIGAALMMAWGAFCFQTVRVRVVDNRGASYRVERVDSSPS